MDIIIIIISLSVHLYYLIELLMIIIIGSPTILSCRILLTNCKTQNPEYNRAQQNVSYL